MLIIVSRDQAGLYQSVKATQEANGRDRVILDRRVADRRRATVAAPVPDRRKAQQRVPVSDAERALMNVLGFMVLHREVAVGAEPRTGPRVRKPFARRPGTIPARESATVRRLRRKAG